MRVRIRIYVKRIYVKRILRRIHLLKRMHIRVLAYARARLRVLTLLLIRILELTYTQIFVGVVHGVSSHARGRGW